MHLSYLQDTLDYEAYKAKQTAYLQRVADLERTVLERTVFVDNVRDLRQQSAEHLKKLQRFMETNFGPVDECVMVSVRGQARNGSHSNHHHHNHQQQHHNHRRNHHHSSNNNNHTNHFPSARVRFVYKEDAEKIFGNRPLTQAKPVRLPCRVVGHLGHEIRVQPSRRYDHMAELSGQTMVVPVTGLEMGHWIPSFHDVYESWDSTNRTTTDGSEPPEEEWMTETRIPGYSFTQNATSLSAKAAAGYHLSLKIDLKERTVEVTARRTSAFCYRQLDTYQFDTHNDYNQHSEQDVLVVRFKELVHHMELCRDESTTGGTSFGEHHAAQASSYYLIARLTVPPRLYREISFRDDNRSGGCVTRQRCMDFAGIAATTLFGPGAGGGSCWRRSVESQLEVRLARRHGLGLNMARHRSLVR